MIKKVVYEFDDSDTSMGFADEQSLKGVDYPASIDEYEYRIKEEIKKEFPEAEIVIQRGYGKVEAYTEDPSSGLTEQENACMEINEIVRRVWEAFDWVLMKPKRHHPLPYSVIEDNGGGLGLFVFNPRKRNAVYAHYGYETTPGTLSTDLNALDGGSDPLTWDGGEESPQALYSKITSYEYGWNVICKGRQGKPEEREIFPERMGAAGRIEFNIE